MKTAEKMIPKAVLLRALHEIMAAARDPEGLLAANEPTLDKGPEHAYALGWIEAIACHALGAERVQTGWLAPTRPVDSINALLKANYEAALDPRNRLDPGEDGWPDPPQGDLAERE
jgi:hypothetical protein